MARFLGQTHDQAVPECGKEGATLRQLLPVPAFDYMLKRLDAFTRFLDDGRTGSNPVPERSAF
jgi:hypothetical protein